MSNDPVPIRGLTKPPTGKKGEKASSMKTPGATDTKAQTSAKITMPWDENDEKDANDDDDESQDEGGGALSARRTGRGGEDGGSPKKGTPQAKKKKGDGSSGGGGGDSKKKAGGAGEESSPRRRKQQRGRDTSSPRPTSGSLAGGSGALTRSHARTLSPKIGKRGPAGGGFGLTASSSVFGGLGLGGGTGSGGVTSGDSGAPKSRALLKEEMRARNWVSFTRRKTRLSLNDLRPEEQPRKAKRSAITPFFMHLARVEGWSIPSALLRKVKKAGHTLRFSTSISFYHCYSRRFYGNTFAGRPLEEYGESVTYNTTKQGKKARQEKKAKKAKAMSRRPLSRKGKRGKEDDDDDDRDEDDDEDGGEVDDEDADITTVHDDVVYWYTRYEDPNCVAVVELVLTEVDEVHDIELGQYGCGWSIIQFFGPNEPRTLQHRDVYSGTPRNLLFFRDEDWGALGEAAIPGCALWFNLQIFEKLLDAKHLMRENELVSALETVPGLEERTIELPWKAPQRKGEDDDTDDGGDGSDDDDGGGRGRRRRRGDKKDGGKAGKKRKGGKGRKGDADDGGGGEGDAAAAVYGCFLGFKLEELGRKKTMQLVPRPLRPQLAETFDFKLTNLRVILPGRVKYERDMLKSLAAEVPDQEVRQTTLKKGVGTLLSSTQALVAAQAAGSSAIRSKIIGRRVKVGFHNGHSLVITGGGWVAASLEETDDDDVLMLASDIDVLEVGGFVKNDLYSLVVLVEYTIRTRTRHPEVSAKGDPLLSTASQDLQQAALPVMIGMQVFVPYDGKRLRLSNTPKQGEDSMDIELALSSGKHVRLITNELFYTPVAEDLSTDQPAGKRSQNLKLPSIRSIFFDLRAYDQNGKRLKDETPNPEDESDLEIGRWNDKWAKKPEKKKPPVYSSDTESATSSEEEPPPAPSSSESSESEEEEEEVKPVVHKRKRVRVPDAIIPKPSPRLVEVDSESSSPRGDWATWRGDSGLKVPQSRDGLLAQSLQAPLHLEDRGMQTDMGLLGADGQYAHLGVGRAMEDDYGPNAVGVNARGLSRSDKTRLSRHGFQDVLQDSVYANRVNMSTDMVGLLTLGREAADLDVEVSDPLALHEVTFQFAGYRCPKAAMPLPKSVYLTYQFYSCMPTRTERMVLEGHHAADDAGQLRVLVRDGRYGRSEPSLAIRHVIDTSQLQPFEAYLFAEYMASKTLYIDVWDGDALMLLGTCAFPLRAVLRQGQATVKSAQELEVIACGSNFGGDVAVRHGCLSGGPVVGLLELLVCNYGQVGRGGGAREISAVVRPPALHSLVDWRLGTQQGQGNSRASGVNGKLSDLMASGRHRPRHRVRARPLSETHPELDDQIAAIDIAGGDDRRKGRRIGLSLVRGNRGLVDGDSMTYDELMLLVRRFRGDAKGKVRYRGALMQLLDVPSGKLLEKRLVAAVTKAQKRGGVNGYDVSLDAIFREFDSDRDGVLSMAELEQLLRSLGVHMVMKDEHLKVLLGRMDGDGDGYVTLREFVTFVQTRQRKSSGRDGQSAIEIRLRRILSKAEAAGVSLEEAFDAFDADGSGELSPEEFLDAIGSLVVGRGLGGPGGKDDSLPPKKDLMKLLKLFDTDGNGLVSLQEFMKWAGRPYKPAAVLEAKVRKILLRAEARGSSLEEVFGALDADGSGKVVLAEMREALVKLGVYAAAAGKGGSGAKGGDGDDVEIVLKRMDKDGDGEIDLMEFFGFLGREWTGTSVLEARLKSMLLRAEEKGTNLEAAFSALDKDGSGALTLDELEKGFIELGVLKLMPLSEVHKVLKKFDTDGSGSVGLPEFMAFLGREYSGISAAQAKLKAILQKAEDLGTSSIAESFAHFDKDGEGSISMAELESALKDLGVFSALPVEEVRRLMSEFDKDGDGQISLEEFMGAMGVQYSESAIAEAKLKRILLKAESKGATLEASFAVLDTDGSGDIGVDELHDGLIKLGVLQEGELAPRQVDLVLKRFDSDGDGRISLREFLAFVGRAYTTHDTLLEKKLRAVLVKAEQAGTPLEDCFKHFDPAGNGEITGEEFRRGLKELGVFEGFEQKEVTDVIRKFDVSGDGSISLSEFMRFMGRDYHVDVGAKLRKTLLRTEEMGTSLEEAFRLLDVDGDGKLTAAELYKGIQGLGTFQGVTMRECDDFVRSFGEADGAGTGSAAAAAAGGGGGKGRKGSVNGMTGTVRSISWKDMLAFVRTPEATLRARRRSLAEDALNRVRRPSRSAGGTGGAALTKEAVDELLKLLKRRLREVEQGTSQAGKKGKSAKGGGGGGSGNGVKGRRGKVMLIFESFDIDDSGDISEEEFERALRCMGLMKSATGALGAAGGVFGLKEVRAVVTRLDTDGDRQVSLAEFMRWYEQSDDDSGDGKGGHSNTTSPRQQVNGTDDSGPDHAEADRDSEDELVSRVREVVLRAEGKGVSMEAIFSHFDEDGDGRLTVKELYAGLTELGVFDQGRVTREDVIDLVERFDVDGSGDIDTVEFIQFIRRGRKGAGGGVRGGAGDDDEDDDVVEGNYDYSNDPDTRDMERKLQRMVGKQVRRGVDVEGLFRRYDWEGTGEVVRSDFAQVMMELGLSLLEQGKKVPHSGDGVAGDIRKRQLAQLARTKGPLERRLLRMRNQNRGLFTTRQRQRGHYSEEGKHAEDAFGGGGGSGGRGGWGQGEMESLALIQWYREGHKKELMRKVLAASLTTEYNLFFCFGRPLFFEHPLHNPFNHEERFIIDVNDPELRIVTNSEEWAYLRRHVQPCVGDIGDTAVESDMFDVDPGAGVQITLLANELVYLPFSFVSLEVKPGYGPTENSTTGGGGGPSADRGPAPPPPPERMTAVSIISASHGHVVNMLQVNLHRRPFVVDRTFRFYQAEGGVLKRVIQLLPEADGLPPSSSYSMLRARKRRGPGLGQGGELFEDGPGGGSSNTKYVHCVEGGGPGDNNGGGGNVIVECRQRRGGGGSGGGGNFARAGVPGYAAGPSATQEIFIKYRVGKFPAQGDFYLLLYEDHHQAVLYETWHVIVQSRLRLDVHSPVGQTTGVDLVVRGDRYARRVRCFSGDPKDVSFEPQSEFQLIPGAYNRVELKFCPRHVDMPYHEGGTGVIARRVHVHMVDLDTRELVGAWLATATAMQPVVTKVYDIDLPMGRDSHKRIAYTNPWSAKRTFHLVSSDVELLQPRYDSVHIAAGGTGYLRLWLHGPREPGTSQAYLFINDEHGQNEECLLIKMRAVVP